MLRNTEYAIEFIGGPFDGYVETLSTRPENLPDHLVCYISRSTFRGLSGQETRQFSATSIAIYSRVLRHDEWAYVFAKAVAPRRVAAD